MAFADPANEVAENTDSRAFDEDQEVITSDYAFGSVQGFVVFDYREPNNAIITEHPVQGSSPISDHIIDVPFKPEMRIIYPNGTDIASAYQQLLDLKQNKELFQFIAEDQIYDNMQFTDVVRIKNENAPYTLECEVSLKQLRIANTQTIQRISTRKANHMVPQTNLPSINTGDKTATPASAENVSFLSQRFGAG